MNGAFHYGLRTFYFCSMLNLCTIGILLCEMSFDNSAVTFLPPVEIYLAQQFSSGTFSGLYARHKGQKIPWTNGVSGIKQEPHGRQFSINREVLIWRRRGDSNSCAGFPTYALSRGASSPTWVLLRMVTSLTYSIKMAERVGFEPTVPVKVRRFSRPFRYDRFGISP